MAILRAEKIKKSFVLRTLFSDVSFEIQAGDKVGFVGVNGCGKTTLLRLIAGHEQPDEGSIVRSSELRIAEVEQLPNVTEERSLYEFTLLAHASLLAMEKELAQLETLLAVGSDKQERYCRRQAEVLNAFTQEGGLTFRAKTRSALLGLGFSYETQDRSLASFSGGQVAKAMLARALLTDANLLLLDEPTNNLDLPSITWLEEFLLQYRGAVLVVSHDRHFLDAVTTQTFELENGHLVAARGNYSRFMELKSDRQEAARRVYQRQKKEIHRIEGIIAQQRRWNQERNYVTIASKEKQIERIRSGMIAPENDPAAIHFSFDLVQPTGNEVITLKQLGHAYDGKTVFRNADLLVKKGECVCLIGANGCGKTTLLKILSGVVEPAFGSFRLGAGVKLGYYEQDTRKLNDERDVIGELSDSFPRLDLSALRKILGGFLFRGDDVYKKISALSGGERARIQLLKLVLSGANVLLLDEPTNHLDIPSAEMLETALESFEGTIFIVSHDRYLVERLADRIVVMTRDGLIEQTEETQDMFRLVRPLMDEPAPKAEQNEDKANYYLLQKQRKLMQAQAKQQVTSVERAIAQAEADAAQQQYDIAACQSSGAYAEMEQRYRALSELEEHTLELYEQLQQAEAAYNELLEEEQK